MRTPDFRSARRKVSLEENTSHDENVQEDILLGFSKRPTRHRRRPDRFSEESADSRDKSPSYADGK